MTGAIRPRSASAPIRMATCLIITGEYAEGEAEGVHTVTQANSIWRNEYNN